MQNNNITLTKEVYPWETDFNKVHIEGYVLQVMRDNRGKGGAERLIAYLYVPHTKSKWPEYKHEYVDDYYDVKHYRYGNILLIMADEPSIILQIEEIYNRGKSDFIIMEGSLEEDVYNRDESGFATSFIHVREVKGWMRNHGGTDEEIYEMLNRLCGKPDKGEVDNTMPSWFNKTSE